MILALAATVALTTTRFHIAHEKGVDWIVRPNGQKLWSFGVCCIGPGATEKTYDPKNPEYASFRYYLQPSEWATDTLDRLTKWGFNTVGAWSDDKDLMAVPSKPDVVFTPILHIGSSAGAPWKDMWDPATVKLMDEVARVQIVAHHNDPRILGYFSDNEQGWWYGAMWDWAFKAGPRSRGYVVDLLEKTYHQSWKALNRDFDPDGASSFKALRQKGHLFLRPQSQGIHVVQRWMSIISDRYYDLCRSIIKKYDPGALYLGDRYISNFYPEIAKSAGKYCDIVSTNLNAVDPQGDFAPFYLPKLHELTGRPIMITEYYETAKENRSGNQNNSSGFPVVQTQAERAKYFKRQTLYFARTPYVVGAHWFQYYDEPQNGRGDGENYDMGLVDIDNIPYHDITATAGAMDAAPGAWHGLSGARRAPWEGALYSESPEPPETISIWFWNAIPAPPRAPSYRADLLKRSDSNGQHFGVYWEEDRFAEAFYRGGKVPSEDRAKLQIIWPHTQDSFLLGDGPPKVMSGRDTVSQPKSGVRNFAVIDLPRNTPEPLGVKLTTRAGAYTSYWPISEAIAHPVTGN